MNHPLALFLAFFAVLPAVFVLLGVWQIGGSQADLPLWYWGAALVFGLLCMAGLLLMRSARPHLPFKARVLRLAAGWALPFACFALSGDGLRGDMTAENLPSALLLRLPVLVAIGLGYGSVMATVQQRKMS